MLFRSNNLIMGFGKKNLNPNVFIGNTKKNINYYHKFFVNILTI